MKTHLFAAAAVLALAACTQDPGASDTTPAPTTPTPSATKTATPEPTEEPTQTETEPEQPALPSAEPSVPYSPENKASQSENWPDISAQALPYAVNYGYNYVDIIYTWDGTGELSWYTDGWADQAVEEGSGLPIDVHSDNVLQIHVAGLRLPEPDEYDTSAFTLSQTETTGMTRLAVAGPFEGQHTVTIGAEARLPYSIEVTSQPNADGGTDAVLRVYFDE
ncbi:AMIN-like domain-containing (lipo)protein [Trueperella bernardiae]|uniref:AMIN-like domain-containing (lipo)protein n=1 Tax=Trueperella bernardiae TaxID=59561 RepID=UPI00288B118C|nr:hypothetical protein [Trueperella bernardiae]